MKKYLLAFIMLLQASAAFAAGYEQVVAGTPYTPEEQARIAAVLRQAEQKGLPGELLANKVKEAAAKRVRFALVLAVLEQRFARMADADAMMTEKKIPARHRQYALQVLTELQEKGAGRPACEKLLDAAAAGQKDFDGVVRYFDALGKYQPAEAAGEHHADILAACIRKGVSPARGERLLYMFTEACRNRMPPDAAKELIVGGIDRDRRLEEIGDSLRDRGASDGRVSDNGRREREFERGRGWPDDGVRGRTGTGGDNIRRGR